MNATTAKIIPFKPIPPDNPDNPLDCMPEGMLDFIEGVMDTIAEDPFTKELIPCETAEDARKYEFYAVRSRFEIIGVQEK
jgi:hypothetical protein